MSSNNQATTDAATTGGSEDIELGGGGESRPTTITEATSHTLETIEDDNVGPIHPSQLETIIADEAKNQQQQQQKRPEQIYDDEEEPIFSEEAKLDEDDVIAKKKAMDDESEVVSNNEMTPPLSPAQIALLCEQMVDDNEGTDDTKLVEKKLEAEQTTTPNQTHHVSVAEDEDEEVNMRMVNAKIGRQDNNNDFGRRTYNTAPPRPSSQSQQSSSRDDHRRTYNTAPPRIVMSPPAQQPERNETAEDGNNMIIDASVVNYQQQLQQQQQQQQEQNEEYAAIIPEAFLVESQHDNDKEEHEQHEPIIISGYATPLEEQEVVPWYKQTFVRVLIGLFILIVTGLSIGFALRPPPETITVTINTTSVPSVSTYPSYSPSSMPSMVPSTSSMPTLVPTTLLARLSNEQKVAIYGNNMVIVTQDWDNFDTMFVVFYVLTNNNTMVPVSAFNEDEYLGVDDDFTVSINGTTSILDFPSECDGDGGQIVYELDDNTGKWYQVEDTRCPVLDYWNEGESESSGASEIGWDEGETYPPTVSPLPVESETSGRLSQQAVVIIISILIPLLFVILPLSIYIYVRHRRRRQGTLSNSPPAQESTSLVHQNEKELALKCPRCGIVSADNYAMVPCGHMLCAKCSEEYETQPCPTCNGRLDGRLRVTCKTSLV